MFGKIPAEEAAAVALPSPVESGLTQGVCRAGVQRARGRRVASRLAEEAWRKRRVCIESEAELEEVAAAGPARGWPFR